MIIVSIATKPIKIELSNGTASGMYILLNQKEILKQKSYPQNTDTKPPNRTYKIQIAIEVMFNNKRCRGKHTFTIPKGTSMIKAVSSLLGKKEDMIKTLKSNGTLKVEKIKIIKHNNIDRSFKRCWELFIQDLKIATKKSGLPASANTLRVYNVFYNKHLSYLDNKLIDNISLNIIETIRNKMLKNKNLPSTISQLKSIMKPLLKKFKVHLDWDDIIFPKVDNTRKYSKGIEDTVKIVDALNNYPHKEVNAIFKFLLTARRLSEVTNFRYEYINWNINKFTIPAKDTKTNVDYTFDLTPDLVSAIKSMGKIKTMGKVFRLGNQAVLKRFKKLMEGLRIYDMVIHDIRAMVAQTALDNGASLYDVSVMLSHKSTKTTQKSYIQGTTIQSTKATLNFQDAIKSNQKIIIPTENIEDIKIIKNEFSLLKDIYPNATDEKLFEIINMMD